MVVSFLGEIVFASFPHLVGARTVALCCISNAPLLQGVNHDLKVWRDTHTPRRIPCLPKEWIMGDPAYFGGHHCVVKYPKHQLCKLFHK